MNKNKIYLSSPQMSAEGYELEYIRQAFEQNWISSLGPNLERFEKEMAKKVKTRNVLALSSGTAAIHLALKAAEVGAGDVVFCSDLTFSASANPIIYQNAVPVFIDSDSTTWNMDPDALEAAFQKYPHAKAVILVHLYGFAADLDRIAEICKRHGAILIEDAAEALGACYKGKSLGTIGDYGVYSFNGNKIITTSGGGMLVSANKERIQKAHYWATQARDPARHYQHSELGYNYRMSNIVAGIGRGQLKVLEERIARKKSIFDFYKKAFEMIGDIQFMPVPEWSEPNYWLSCIRLTGRVWPLHLIETLEEQEIESRPLWKPMHLQPFFETYDYIGNGVSEQLYNEGVCLPSDTNMTDEDLRRIANIIINLWK